MPLVSVNRPGISTANGVHFPMRDEQQRSVRVHVTLDALSHAGPSAGNDSLKRFEAGRRLFEFVAARKYGSGPPTPRITITAVDVVLTAREMQRKIGSAHNAPLSH